MSRDLLKSTSMNQVYDIICLDLKFNDRKICHVVDRYKLKPSSVMKYMRINHLSDMSVIWWSICGSIGCFTRVKKRCTCQPPTKDHHNLSTTDILNLSGTTSPSPSSPNTSVKSISGQLIGKNVSSIVQFDKDTENDISVDLNQISDLKLKFIAELKATTTKGHAL